MSEAVVVKRRDRFPIQWQTSMDLTGCTVKLILKHRSESPIEVPTTIIDAPNGVVEQMLDGQLPAKEYSVELEITYGAIVRTAPTKGYSTLTITPDLG